MSKIEVNAIETQSGTTLTLGASGDTVTLAAGASQSGFGRTGTVDWDTTPKTTTVTAVSGVGYFVDTTTTTLTVNLPVGSAGSIVAVSDYANTAATNNITISPNGTDKINGTNQPTKITTNGASATLIYVDSTRGWKDVNDATLDLTGLPPFVAATGGTILTCGDFKTHVFTGPGTFTVTNAGNPAGSNSVEYLVVAGGGGSAAAGPGLYASGGGGGGGFRQNYPNPTTAGLPVTAQAYPITVGGGGSCGPTSSPFQGTSGSNSIFSTITSTGGGYGARGGPIPVCSPAQFGAPGGSGGGGGAGCGATPIGSPGGTGNTPPVSPSQGNNGGAGSSSGPTGGGGGGGAGVVGSNVTIPNPTGIGAPGGGGSPIATAFFGPTSPSYGTTGPAPGRYFAGGGGGGGGYFTAAGTQGNAGFGGGGQGGGTTGPGPVSGTAGTANTGGGAGGTQNFPSGQRSGNAGGSGIVAIRYKFQ
jgi:hypothetical protein